MRSMLVAVLVLACVQAQDVPEGLSTSDWSSIRAAYEAGRHKVFAVDGGHQARSPSQQWNVRFDGRGVVVQPDADEWTWGLDLVSWGFVGGEHVFGEVKSAQADGQRLTYQWKGLDEWYVNGTGGIEHGYTVHRRPDGDGTLTFLLRVRGELSPTVQNNGRDVVFQRDGETTLSYTGLHVFDADGVTLPARFTVQEHGLLLSIDERGARYPVTIDPIAQHAYLKASNTGTFDQFGWSVAVSGDTVVVGAYQERSNATGVNGNQADNSANGAGAAYVFVRNGTTWTQQAYLKASNTDVLDLFGESVAVSGDTVVVGARSEGSNATGVNGNQANNSFGNAGAAYVFVRSGTTWSQQAYLKASNTGASDFFGEAVAVSGDTVVVGASWEASNATGINGNQVDNSAYQAGAAYVFDISRVRPSLWPLNAPQIGQSYTLAIDNLHPIFNFAILAFGFTQFALPGVDLGFLDMPCCDLYQTADILITANPGAGGSTQWTWSPVAGVPGDTFHCQAFCLDPAANALGLTISNAITIKLVP